MGLLPLVFEVTFSVAALVAPVGGELVPYRKRYCPWETVLVLKVPFRVAPVLVLPVTEPVVGVGGGASGLPLRFQVDNKEI